MKTRFYILIARLCFLSLLLPETAPLSAEAHTNSAAQPKAPTGLYVSVPEISPWMTIRFATNGNYHVDVGPCGLGACQSQDGTWRWDSRQQELLLTTTHQLWRFDFGRFRVEAQAPDTLEWVPRQGTNNVLGVYKTIKFTRQADGS
jgi:hypothetical protein